MSGSSPWNHGAFSFSPNTNTMDDKAMQSDKAAAARARAKEILLALEDGKPGAADRMMGEREPKGNVGLLPIDWMKTKFARRKSSKGQGKEGDGVVR